MASQDLVTITEVREHLKIATAETDRNALLATLITAASDAIMAHTQRELCPQTNAAARSFRWEGGALDLAPYDLRSVTSIVMDTDGTNPANTTLTADDYRLLPIPTKHGVYTHVEFRGYAVRGGTSAHTYRPSRQVTITGNWGWYDTANVPTNIKMACKITVGHWERKFSQYFAGAHAGDLDDGRFGAIALPSAALFLLDPYRRIGG